MINGFFAYPSQPRSVGDSVSAAIDEINRAGEVDLVPWARLSVTGKVIIDQILEAIDRAELICADITDANPNVLFELGYAIAKNKRIWLTVDRSYTDSNAKLESLRILTTIGYAPYENSRDIVRRFYEDRPHTDLHKTIFAQSIQPALPATAQNFQILYIKSPHENEAAIRVARRMEDSRLKLIIDDPRESPIQPLTWYGTQAYLSAGVICHLTDPRREQATIYNARAAFVAGMAHAMGKELLMLVEGDYLVPIDYRDLVSRYTTARSALTAADLWLTGFERDQKVLDESRSEYFRTVALATQLKSLQIGEYIAENEIEKLTEEYFVETATYADAVSGRHTVFAGRKGTGKTATFLKMQTDLMSDRRNVVVSIRPAAYEVQGIIKRLGAIQGRDVKGFAIESLWKFLLMSELAKTLASEFDTRVAVTLSADELAFQSFINQPESHLSESFVDRLEHKVEQYSFAENAREAISEDIHRGIIHRIKQHLLKVLGKKQRIAFLIDNLDLAWDKVEDFPVVSQLILGLLEAARSLMKDLSLSNARGRDLTVSLALFLRSDILAKVRENAPEPDKVDAYTIRWTDREVLGRVIDERLVTSQDTAVSPEEMWARFFVPNVRGIPTRAYILNMVLPRPRDLVYFVRSAVTHAINRAHTRVEEDDVLTAEQEYSRFAKQMLMVESAGFVTGLEDVLLAFAGAPTILDRITALARLADSGYSGDASSIVDALIALGFFGLEIRPSEFEFSADLSIDPRSVALARTVAKSSGGEQRLAIHTAFWNYLNVDVDYATLRTDPVFNRS
jgi:hypothetical protein